MSIKIKTQNIDKKYVFNNCTFNNSDALEMQQNIPDMVGNSTVCEYRKKLFQWKQANFGKLKTGNKGLISNIHAKALRVIFDSETIKSQMTTTDDDGINWQDKYYTVDVEVQMGDKKKPVQYKILRNYPKDSFPISEE